MFLTPNLKWVWTVLALIILGIIAGVWLIIDCANSTTEEVIQVLAHVRQTPAEVFVITTTLELYRCSITSPVLRLKPNYLYRVLTTTYKINGYRSITKIIEEYPLRP